ncbi:MAG: GNAT family N-acetyltransferase [Phycisphaerae bacterium]
MLANWRDRLGSKLTTLRKALGHIRRGERIYLSDGSATPTTMIPGLVAEDVPLGDNQIIHLLTLGEAPYTNPEHAGRFRHNALFIGANVRDAVSEGRADYTPVFLSEIPRLIRAGRIPIDVAVLSVTPPDEDGYCSYGTHVDLAPAVVEVARAVIVEVNPRMPYTFGPCRLHVEQITAAVEGEHTLPELKPAQDRPETDAIARSIADLVPDGATLQLGIGGIPNQVLRYLVERRDLGVHTEMFSDGVVDLVERGVITGARKSLHPGKIVAGFLMGTQRVYDFVNRNPMVELHPSDYANDPFVIAKNDHMVAVNMALEIDLTGQVCADSIGPTFYSGIGGQVDFIRGAARSRGGRPIIAMPSTALDGTVSRIVPRLSDGAGVVTTRGDVHYVVTEYGVADLHGRTVRERAMALISIAHPRFRPWLLAEAKRHRFIYTDQLEPPFQASLYPRQLETRTRAKDGTAVLLRPIRPTDEEALRELFYRLSQETVYERFMVVKRYLPHQNLQRFCTIDYDRDMTFVASVREGDVEKIVGWALYTLNPTTDFAEAAFLVDDAYQGRGIGTLLMRRLTEIAEARNLRGFTAVVLATNIRMLRVFEKCGYPLEIQRHGETLSLRIAFGETTRRSWDDRDKRAEAR